MAVRFFVSQRGNFGLTSRFPQTVMVVYQSRLFLHTIRTTDGRGVRPFFILYKPLCFLTHNRWGFLQVHSYDWDRTYPVISLHFSWLLHLASLSGSCSLFDSIDPWYNIDTTRWVSNNLNQSHLFFLKMKNKKLVHALYHGSVLMRRVLAVFFSIEIIGMIVGLSLSLPRITYDNLCLVIFAPRTLIIYAYVIFSRPPTVHPSLTDRLYI